MLTSDTPSDVARASSSAVTGPDTSRCPRSISAATVSASMGLTRGRGAIAKVHSAGYRPARSGTRSVAHHRPAGRLAARPAAASSANHAPHSGCGRIRYSVISRSCSSSASRGCGRTCSLTFSIASGSSRARSRASTGSPRETVT